MRLRQARIVTRYTIWYNGVMDDQIFIRLNPDEEPIRFLLTAQPLEMIRANVVTQDEIRITVETGHMDVDDLFSQSFPMSGFNITMNVYVRMNDVIRTIEYVEKTYL